VTKTAPRSKEGGKKKTKLTEKKKEAEMIYEKETGWGGPSEKHARRARESKEKYKRQMNDFPIY